MKSKGTDDASPESAAYRIFSTMRMAGMACKRGAESPACWQMACIQGGSVEDEQASQKSGLRHRLGCASMARSVTCGDRCHQSPRAWLQRWLHVGFLVQACRPTRCFQA